MDCLTARERMVPWLDGELSPGERDQLERHVEQCARCAERAAELAEQQDALRALRPPERPVELRMPGVWDRMDHCLAEALEREERAVAEPVANRAPFLVRELRITGRAAIAYAAILVLSLLWGWRAHVQLDHAVESSKQLNLALEREQRLSDDPSPLQQGDSFRPVDYTPSRGSF